MPKGTDNKVLAQNRKANHDYTILDTIEAGLVLTGTEIKSVRQARMNLKDGYCSFKNGEAFLVGVHISPFEQGNIFNHDPLRTRKLLLHKKQIQMLEQEVRQAGNTVVPLKVYIKNGVAKLLIGIAKGKKNYDKREALKQKDIKQDVQRELKNYLYNAKDFQNSSKGRKQTLWVSLLNFEPWSRNFLIIVAEFRLLLCMLL